MSASDSDTIFDGSIPKLYELYFVPMVFQPCAADLVQQLGGRSRSGVLEIAAGTGVVTRALASTLPASVSIVAMDLPYPNEMFDAVICQFGVMFSPTRRRRSRRRAGSCVRVAFLFSTPGIGSKRTSSSRP